MSSAEFIERKKSVKDMTIQTGRLQEVLEDCSLRAEIIAAIGLMSTYELTIAAAYINRLIKSRGKEAQLTQPVGERDAWERRCAEDTSAHTQEGKSYYKPVAAQPADGQCADCDKLIGERDEMEERVNRIITALGIPEPKCEWSSTNDPSERAIERIEELLAQPADGAREPGDFDPRSERDYVPTADGALREVASEYVNRCPMCKSGAECQDDLCFQFRRALAAQDSGGRDAD